MKGFHATVDAKEFGNALARVETRMHDASPAMEAASEALYQFVVNTFRDQTDPWGVPWPAWAPDTLKARRARKDYRLQKLVDSRDMLNSVTKSHTATTATVEAGRGLKGDYAVDQQFGNDHIPARPFFPMHDESDSNNFPQAWLDAVFAPIQAAMNEAVR